MDNAGDSPYPDGSVMTYRRHLDSNDRPGAKELAPLARLPRLRRLNPGGATPPMKRSPPSAKNLNVLKGLVDLDLRSTGVTNKGPKILAE